MKGFTLNRDFPPNEKQFLDSDVKGQNSLQWLLEIRHKCMQNLLVFCDYKSLLCVKFDSRIEFARCGAVLGRGKPKAVDSEVHGWLQQFRETLSANKM